MRRGERFPGNQAEVVFSDRLVEQLEGLQDDQRLDVVASIINLCDDPSGKHPLASPLAGWNTIEVLERKMRVVYKASIPGGTGLVEALCIGPRSDAEVYDMATALVTSGCLEGDDATQLWDALGLLDVAAHQVGLDGWDYRPAPAPEGMQRAVVASGLLEPNVATLLSVDELLAAQTHGWGDVGADPVKALRAALERARGSADFSERAILRSRNEDRCNILMSRAQRSCIRRSGHPGPHRAT